MKLVKKKESSEEMKNCGSGVVFIVKNKEQHDTLKNILCSWDGSHTLILYGDFKLLYNQSKWKVFENY